MNSKVKEREKMGYWIMKKVLKLGAKTLFLSQKNQFLLFLPLSKASLDFTV